jgi:hypothetical protein
MTGRQVAAQRLYKSHGFRETARERDPPGNTVIRYEKDV